ncbi:MAG: DNA repair protein RecN [Acidobacteriota bacterium]
MLNYLKIENIATVREFTLEPGSGLNVLTGETGAGKSIVVSALSLVLGARASRKVLRTGAETATVVASFDLAERPELVDLLDELGLPAEDTLVIRRDVGRSGRHRILVNGLPATQAMLARLGALLGEVHGQHENLQLLQPGVQRRFLDDSGDLGALLEIVASTFERMNGLERELAGLESRSAQASEREDLLRFQLEEIDAAELTVPAEGDEEEDVVLEREHSLLGRAEELAAVLGQVRSELSERDDAVTATLARSRRRLESQATAHDGVAEALGLVKEAQLLVEEATRGLTGLAIEPDPRRLAQLGERLALLDRLTRRHGASLDEVRTKAERLRRELAELSGLDDRRDELAAAVAEARRDHLERAEELSSRRRQASRQLTRAVEERLGELGLPGGRFEVEVGLVESAGSGLRHRGTPVQSGPAGFDRVRFLFSANSGEQPRPLTDTASGGELSRLMLLLKGLRVRSERRPARTMVFDEVDAGLGGEAAVTVGRRLADLAATGEQVLCVTHLPPVAAQADHHHLVVKRKRAGRMETEGGRLDDTARLAELARMLSGRNTAAAREAAAELMNRATVSS